jgi:hypothetical protein
MAYGTGGIAAAADYMGFRGSNDPSSPYPNNTAATNAIAALIGVGYGSRGYGQISTVLPATVTGNTITAALWNSLYGVMSTLNTHTGSGLTLPGNVVPGDTITANDGTGGKPNLASLCTSLDSSRLSYNISQMQLSSKLSSSRTTAWSNSVYHEFTLTFSNEDLARYFFNSGGQIYISASRTGGTSNYINSSLSRLLSDMGTIQIGSQSTTYTGVGGTAYPIGYYGLTGTYQTLFVHLGTTYGYTSMSYTVTARTENITSSNGGNGSIIRIRSTIATNAGGYYGHVLDGTLTNNVAELKAVNALTISSPDYVTTHSI